MAILLNLVKSTNTATNTASSTATGAATSGYPRDMINISPVIMMPDGIAHITISYISRACNIISANIQLIWSTQIKKIVSGLRARHFQTSASMGFF